MTLAGTAEAFYGGPVSQLGTGNCGLDIADFAMQHGGDPLLWGSGAVREPPGKYLQQGFDPSTCFQPQQTHHHTTR